MNKIITGLLEALAHSKGKLPAKETRLPYDGSGSFVEGTRD